MLCSVSFMLLAAGFDHCINAKRQPRHAAIERPSTTRLPARGTRAAYVAIGSRRA
jgi:hypothetical protein